MNRSVWWASATFAAILGFSRVSFGLLLPFLKHEFPASYTAYGIVASANFAGYLLGLIALSLVPRHYHGRRSNTIALALIAVTLALSAIAPNLMTIAAARFVNGLAQAVATILTIGLTFSTVPHELRGRASGIVCGGGGVGIVLCAVALPYAASTTDGGRAIWLAMAVATALVAVGLHRALPAHKAAHRATSGAGATDASAIAILCVQYAFFGAAFADYFTYAPALASKIVAGAAALAVAWSLTGISGSAGASLWGMWLDRSRRGMTLGLCLLAGGAGAVALVMHSLVAAAASAIVVGSCAFGTPAQTTALTRRFSSSHAYVRTLSLVTMSFAIGQTIGAPLGGAIADRAGLPAAILASAAIFAVGGFVALAIALRAPIRISTSYPRKIGYSYVARLSARGGSMGGAKGLTDELCALVEIGSVHSTYG